MKTWLTLSSVALAFGITGSAGAESTATPTLKEAFQGQFYVGVAVNRAIATDSDALSDNVNRTHAQVDRDTALVKAQFNQTSPENDLKWALIQPHPGIDGYDFAPADAYVNFGTANHMLIVGHTLVWHNQTPDWVFAGSIPAPASAEVAPATPGHPAVYSGARASREELLQRMRDHIHTVVGRYKGRVKVWDVVNEAVEDKGPNQLRNSLWLQIIGPDFIAKAFQYAHEADPDAILRYNDYSLENPQKRAKFIALIRSLQAQHVPVMAIGTQTHVNVSWPTYEMEDQELTDLETLGLPIHITELDVNGARAGQKDTGADVANNAATTKGGLVDDANRRLSAQYANLFRAFVKHTSVKVVTFWGVNDGVSWRASGHPLLFDGNDQPKPAFQAVIAEAKGAPASK